MRYFQSQDGKTWSLRLDNALARTSGFSERVGWEAILFETVPPSDVQKIVFRPAGWLDLASAADMAAALQDAVAVRTRWETPPQIRNA